MSGARRHCPAAVTDTERDMSRELNTAGKEHRIRSGSTGSIRGCHTVSAKSTAVIQSKIPTGPWGHSLLPCSRL